MVGLLDDEDPQGFFQRIQPHSNSLIGLGLGLLSGQGNQDAFAQGLQGFQGGSQIDQRAKAMEEERQARLMEQQEKAHQRNATAAFLVRQGVMPNEEAAMQAIDAGFAKELFSEAIKSKGSSAELGLSPIYGVDAEGNPTIMQMSPTGRAHQTQMPEGFRLSRDPIKMDAGTHFVLLDPVTRQQIGVIPKDIAGAAAQEQIGQAQGEAITNLPSAVGQAKDMLGTIEDLRTDPNREIATGRSSVFNAIPASPGYDYRQKVLQAKGKTFLQAYESLKGSGQITEVEGLKAEQAIARLDTAQSEPAFLQALKDLEDVVKRGLERARAKAGQGGPSQPTPGASDLRSKYGLE